jgi:hypothetical protein
MGRVCADGGELMVKSKNIWPILIDGEVSDGATCPDYEHMYKGHCTKIHGPCKKTLCPRVTNNIVVRHHETGELETFKNLKDVLKEINRDRSSGWTRYDECDWQEGLEEFTEYELVSINGNGI